MTSLHGRFVWYELMTTDPAAAAGFYRSVVGWTPQDASHPGMSYTLFMDGAEHVGGMMALPEEALQGGARPFWLGYVEVDDVDAATDQAKALGGAVHRPPADIPNVGRFSVVADPQGAVLALYKDRPREAATAPPELGAPRRFVWRELFAGDQAAAFDFYAALFGWTRDHAFDTGEHGTYQVFAAGGQMLGGMITKPPHLPRPFWTYYVQVEGVDATADKVTAGGGRVLLPPTEVPGGAFVVQALDPQGAMICFLGPRG